MKKAIVVRPLVQNGPKGLKAYTIDDPIELEDTEYENLSKAGIVRPAPKEKHVETADLPLGEVEMAVDKLKVRKK